MFLLLLLAAVVGLFLSLRSLGNVRRRLDEVSSRLVQVEAALHLGTFAAPPPSPVETAPKAAPQSTEGDVGVAGARPLPAVPPADEAAPAGVPTEPVPAAPTTPTAAEPPVEEPTFAPTRHASPPRGIEEQFGTRWAVWVGGVALALGGVFLVQYSIDQGWIGPGARIALGALLAATLIAAGEWLRRRERSFSFVGVASAHIPSILTAAGTVAAYATVFAAYALYGFLAGPIAFLLLAAVALATLVAALLHGPALAAMGVVGAFVTPLLISSPNPNYWALTLYLAVVTAAALALARARLWRWLAVTAIVLSLLWMLPAVGDTGLDVVLPYGFHVLAGFVLAGIFVVSGLVLGPDPVAGKVEFISSGAIAAFVLAAAALVIAQQHDGFTLVVLALTTVGTLWIAGSTEAAAGAVPVAAVLVGLVIADWALEGPLSSGMVPGGPGNQPILPRMLVENQVHLIYGAGLAILFGLDGFYHQGRSIRPVAPMLWAVSAVLAPIAILTALYYRLAGLERSIPFAAAALVMAVLFAGATDRLTRRAPAPGTASAAAIFATGAVAALALGLTFALEKGWLSVGFALMAPGVAWVANRRQLPMLRWLVVGLDVLVLGRIVYEQQVTGSDLGTTPLFNWLLYSYGGPAASFWLAGWLLRRKADDVPTRTTESAALLFTVLLFFFEVRHWMHSGNIYADTVGLGETALQVSVGLALTIGLERVRLVSKSRIHDVGALVVAGLTGLGIVGWLLLFDNPWLSQIDVGGRWINLILLGYLVPALLATVLVRVTRQTRPPAYRWTAEIAAVALTVAYLTLQVARLYHGPVIFLPTVGDAEQYTYSAVWLAYGVALLFAGILFRSQSIRLASAAMIVITVGKVFLVDLSGLTGIYRALSFICLGLVLIGIGGLYQRLLFPAKAPNDESPSQTPEAHA